MTYESEVLADSPQVYWRFGEADHAGTAQDATANDRDGTYSGTYLLGVPGLVPTSADTALQVTDPAGGYCRISGASWMTSNVITAEVWAQRNGNAHDGNASGCLMSRDRTSASFSLRSWYLHWNDDGTITFRAFGGSSARFTLTSSAISNSRHHIVATYDGANARIYVDGAQIASTAATGTLNSNNDLDVGRNATAAADGLRYFNGTLDEAAFYTTALSAARILAHYDASGGSGSTVTLAGACPAPTAAMSLDAVQTVTLAGAAPAPTAALNLTVVFPTIETTLAGACPAPTAAATVVTEDLSDWAEALLDTAGADLMYWARHHDGEGSAHIWDSSGDGHHGTITHRPQGPHEAAALAGEGGSVDWGGNPSEVDSGTATVPDGGWYDPSGGVTFGTWLYVEGLGDQQRILDKQVGLFAFLSSSSRVVGGFANTSGGLSADFAITPGLHFLTFTVPDTATLLSPGGGTFRAYLDGAPANGAGAETHLALVTDPDEPLNFGFQAGGGEDSLYGPQDETFIIGRALTPTEVLALYLSGLDARITLACSVTPAASMTLLAGLTVTLAGSVSPTASFDIVSDRTVTLNGVAPRPTTTFTLVTIREMTLTGVAPRPETEFTIGVEAEIALAGSVSPVASFLLAFPPSTDMGNRVGGRTRLGSGVATWSPPVTPVPIPFAVVPPRARVVAQAFSEPTILPSGRPVYTVTLRERGALRDRIVVGNTDVTFLRGVPTPFPGYGLTEPLMYGPTAITFPQIAAPFEQPGVGALKWLQIGKPVYFQRVDPATDAVVKEDYIGVVVGFDVQGPALVAQVGGEAMGRAALVNRQVPIWTSVQDIGRYAYSAMKDIGLRLTPYLGPETGVRLQRFGGQSVLDYISEIVARSWNREGNRWTIMPDKDLTTRGVYKMKRKDTTTVTATAYVDDARVVASLHRDAAEEPNRIYGTGVTPNGMRVRNGVYPGLRQSNPAPYPFLDGRDFGTGTTDGATDTGDGITVMIARLIVTKYLDQEDTPGGYDNGVRRAIQRLQEDAADGPAFVTGIMDTDTWAALYDLDVTGYSLRWSHIEPMAQHSHVRKWRRSATGAIMGRNPRYDEAALKVDRNIDFGSGLTSDQMNEWSQAELGEAGQSNWTGSITFATGALIRGEHNPGDPFTDDDVMPSRDLRPGDNLWLPTFDGGTMVHIAACNVGADGSVSTDVDTRARDAMEVWEVISRNRESRNSPARAWQADHRSSTMTKDSIGVWDEVGGLLGDPVPVPANAWVVFPVVAGQEGTVRSLRLRTSPAAEFVTAVFGDTIYASRLQSLVGNPLTRAGKQRWADTEVRAALDQQNLLLYVAGDKEEPCGYFPNTKHLEDDPDTPTEETGTNDLTGRWEDDASFSYHTGQHPVLWVAIFADRATMVPRGRVMWNQLEAGA